MSWRKNRRQEDPDSVIDKYSRARYESPSDAVDEMLDRGFKPGESRLNVSPEGEVSLKTGIEPVEVVTGLPEPWQEVDPNAGGQVGSGGQSLDDFRFARPTPEHQVPEHYGTLLATSGAIEVLSTPFGTWRWHIADHELVRYAGGERQEASWLLKTDDTVKMVTKKAARKEYERLVKETKP